jgi:hypothetical protein
MDVDRTNAARDDIEARADWSRRAMVLRDALERGDRAQILRVTRATREQHGASAMLQLLSEARGFPSRRL